MVAGTRAGIGIKMGIKFLCPNGHKLHVKSFLRGKKAICPKCGARVVVPGAPAPEARTADEAEVHASGPAPGTPSDPRHSHATTTGAEHELAASISQAQTTDPIEADPDAVWYVRPTTGGQFGPASGPMMRSWIRDGRVGGSSLVWRAGWDQWRSAADAFPELHASPDQPQPSATGAGAKDAGASAGAGNGATAAASLPLGHAVQSVAATPQPTVNTSEASVPPLARAVRKRRRRKDVRLIASAILGVVSLILVIVLVLVFRSQRTVEDPKIEEPRATGEVSLI